MGYKTPYPFHIITKPIGPICNLDCDYCFYLEKKDSMFSGTENFAISDKTLESFIKSYISQQPDATTDINFAWQGGEPTLLGVDFFKKVIKLQNKHNKRNLTISNGFQTNGTLLDHKWGKFLHDNKFLVGISIDGPEEIHNKFRKDKDGRGSFNAVMNGLDILKKHRVEFNILTVVQSDNSRYSEKVYEFLKSTGAKHLQFIPIVEPDPTTSNGLSTRSVEPAQWGKFLNTIFDIWLSEDVGNIFIQHFEMLLSIMLGYPSPLCVHSQVCGRAVAMEHNGNIYSCDHFVFPENYLGNINSSNIAKMIDSPEQQKFGTDKYMTLADKCKSCNYLKLCYGGCPAHRISSPPSKDFPINILCTGYLDFYKHTEKYLQALIHCIRSNIPLNEHSKHI